MSKLARPVPSGTVAVGWWSRWQAKVWLAGSVRLDGGGYIVTGSALGSDTRHESPWTGLTHDPYLLETSTPGVFAAGDVRSGSVKRAAAAVGEGSMAVRLVSEHLGRRAGFAMPSPRPG